MRVQEQRSFACIAREMGVSRQAVHDAVHSAVLMMEEYDAKLGLYRDGHFVPAASSSVSQNSAAADCLQSACEKLLGIKRKIARQGIIYSADWIVREIDTALQMLETNAKQPDDLEAVSPELSR